MEDSRGFELLLADDAKGRPVTRFQQYDLAGNRLIDYCLQLIRYLRE